LLLDEPAAGCRRAKAHDYRGDRGAAADIALLIIEHDMDLVFRLARRIPYWWQGSVS